MKRIFYPVVVATMGIMMFSSCSNEDLVGEEKTANYVNNFEKAFGQVNPNQNFNTLKTVSIETSYPEAQGTYTLRVFDAQPNSKDASLIGKFENLDCNSVSTVKVDVSKAADNIYCVADNGETHKILSPSVAANNRVTAKFRDSSPDAGNITNNQPNYVTIAFEDLGSTEDFDFNDVVIRVEYTTGTTTAVVKLMAVGGTLPVKLSYNYDTHIYEMFSGEELHAAMGESDSKTVINANGGANPNATWKDNVEYAIDEIGVPNDFVLGEGFDGAGGPFILEVDGKQGQIQITSSTAYGATPQALVLGKYSTTTSTTTSTSVNTTMTIYGFRWPKENMDLKAAYPGITTWMSNPNDISFLASGVDSKLYDGYDPTEIYHYSTPLGLKAIDLKLPSGTLWANMNVGANAPEDYGGYYAWGETEEKEVYFWSTYIHCDGSSSTCRDLGSDIAGTKYDVAHVKWGGDWQMPTQGQIDELLNNTTHIWTTQNGVNGRLFTGSNGNSIFLPAAGYRWKESLGSAGSYGDYWSSTQDPSRSSNAYYLYFGSGNADLNGYYRYNGQSVRPVVRN